MSLRGCKCIGECKSANLVVAVNSIKCILCFVVYLSKQNSFLSLTHFKYPIYITVYRLIRMKEIP